MTNVSPWIIHTLTFPRTVHCPFSHRDVVQTSQVHPNPVIWYALSHISLIISSSKQPPYLPIMAFPNIPRYIAMQPPPLPFDDLSIHCHIALHDHITDIVVIALPPFIIFHTCYARSLHILVHCQRHSCRVIFCFRYRVVIFISFEL